jgi:hypothetical protein
MNMNLEKQLNDLHQQEHELLQKIEEQNKRKKIPCKCCNKNHSIYKLTAIQTYWYVEPSGCTDGGYWREGEMQFICPLSNIRNRILFDNYDVEWHLRDKYDFSPELQFKGGFRKLFKEVTKYYDKNGRYQFVNNYYVDQHRKKFGLCEKEK